MIHAALDLTLQCDGLDCHHAKVKTFNPSELTPSEARVALRRFAREHYGWDFQGNLDLCPQCLENRRRQPGAAKEASTP